MCGDPKMIKAYQEGKDLYAEIAALSFNTTYDNCLEFRPDGTINPDGKNRRSQAKSILLGVLYGRGVPSIAEQLGTLVSQVFDIERNGAAGSTQTTYEIYPVDAPDNTTLEDLPEFEGVMGGVILDKSVEDMEYYLEDGQFPPEVGEAPARRRDAVPRRREDVRRTPRRNNDSTPF